MLNKINNFCSPDSQISALELGLSSLENRTAGRVNADIAWQIKAQDLAMDEPNCVYVV